MKKISKQEAIRQLGLEIFPKCEVSREVFKSIKTLDELQQLEKKSSVQKFELYGYDEKTIEAFVIPKDALPITIDEATDLIMSPKPEDAAYIKVIECEEQKFSQPSQLSEFISLYRKCTFKGDSFLLYWRDCE